MGLDKTRLMKPEPLGPRPALISQLGDARDTVDLIVFLPTGRHFIATGVTHEPTTPVRHYWQFIPSEERNHAVDK